jgi:hypothetical protein
VLEGEENKPLFSKGGHLQRPILPTGPSTSQHPTGNINKTADKTKDKKSEISRS